MLNAILTLVAMEQNEDQKVNVFTRVLMLAAAVLFVHHFACTLIYNAPYKPWGRSVENYAKAYISPYFFQGWKMFAPEVNQYYYLLEYRHFSNGKWSDYEEVHTLDGVAMPRRVQKIEYKLLVQLAIDISKQIEFDDDPPDFEPITHTSSYGRVVYYAFKRHGLAQRYDADSLQVRMRTKYAPEFLTGLSIDDRYYVFPPIALAHESN